jgi:hypothetical protein
MTKTRARFAAALIALVTSVGVTVSPRAQERAFDFALIGDMPYTKVQEREYQRVLAALNGAELAFVAHIGDFQYDATPYNRNPATASMPCVDENYRAILDSFRSVRHPFVFTPGDNDWTDCWPLQARKVDPLELLDKVRTMFFPEGRTLGQRSFPVAHQSADPRFAKFRENLSWNMGGVHFTTMHIVGSNDNFGRTPEMDAEHLERKAANVAWLRRAFAEARATGARGLVLLTQANPGFENFWPTAAKIRYFLPFIPRGQKLPEVTSPFADYVATLADELERFDRPVLYLHGDTHLFRIDRPLYSAKTNRVFTNFTRVETFGWPDSHWVRITVDPADPRLFRVTPEIVAENAVERRAP